MSSVSNSHPFSILTTTDQLSSITDCQTHNHNDTEIEIKVKLDVLEYSKAKSWASTHGVFVSKVVQKEIYLDNPDKPFTYIRSDGIKDANDYLRIRITDSVSTLCFKRVHRDSDGKNPYCDEYELEISDHKKALDLFMMIGYTHSTILEKTREIFTYDDYEISFDELPNVGLFMEVELKRKENNIIKGLKEIENFIKTKIEVSNYRKQTHGYVSMIWNPEFDFGEM